MPEMRQEYIYVPLGEISQPIFCLTILLICDLMCLSLSVCVSLDNYMLPSWQGNTTVFGEALPRSHNPFGQKEPGKHISQK